MDGPGAGHCVGAPVRPAMLTMDVAEPAERWPSLGSALPADEEILAVAECPLLSNRV